MTQMEPSDKSPERIQSFARSAVTRVEEIRTAKHLEDLIPLARLMHQENAPFLDFDERCIEVYFENVRIDYNRDIYNGFIAYTNGIACGFIICVCTPYFFSRQVSARQELWYVIPSLRNARTAFALMQAFEEWARLRGAVEITAGVMIHDQPIRVERVSNLLEKMSYPKTGYYHTRLLIRKDRNNGN